MSGAFVGLWLGALIAVISWGVTDTNWRQETVNRGLALYCPNDGEWAWKGECE